MPSQSSNDIFRLGSAERSFPGGLPLQQLRFFLYNKAYPHYDACLLTTLPRKQNLQGATLYVCLRSVDCLTSPRLSQKVATKRTCSRSEISRATVYIYLVLFGFFPVRGVLSLPSWNHLRGGRDVRSRCMPAGDVPINPRRRRNPVRRMPSGHVVQELGAQVGCSTSKKGWPIHAV